MSDSVTLGERMKRYEREIRQVLPARTLKVVRVDGRAFHTYTRGLDRPFDAAFTADMDAVALSLTREIPGALMGFVQSDECSVVFDDAAKESTEPWLGGVVAKIVSLTAARASATLTFRRPPARPEDAPLFDSRVMVLPNAQEAANYLLWRQRDAVRNSISMAAQARFSHRELHGKNVQWMRAALAEAGAPWEGLDDGVKFGRMVTRRSFTDQVTWTHSRTKESTTTTVVRSRFEVSAARRFESDPGGWLMRSVLGCGAADVRREEVR